MKIILFLVVSGITNGTDAEFRYQLEKEFAHIEECVQTSIVMRKVLRAEDNLQARQTDVYAHCEANKEGISATEYAEVNSKIRRLEKYYTSAKW